MVLNFNFDGINPSYDNESYAKMFYVDMDIVVVLKPLYFKKRQITDTVVQAQINESHFPIQSTLVISKSKGPSEKLRDIRTSTYQICRIEENTNRTTKFPK